MQLFLQPSEVQELTGYKRKADQRARLATMGIHFYTDRLGKPVVLREALLQSGSISVTEVAAKPDFESLRQLENGAKTKNR